MDACRGLESRFLERAILREKIPVHLNSYTLTSCSIKISKVSPFQAFVRFGKLVENLQGHIQHITCTHVADVGERNQNVLTLM